MTIRPSYHLLLDSEQGKDHPRHFEIDAAGVGDDRSIYLIAHGLETQYEENGIYFDLTVSEAQELVDLLQKLIPGKQAS